MLGFSFGNDTPERPEQPTRPFAQDVDATQQLPETEKTISYDSMPMPPMQPRAPKKSHFARNAILVGIALCLVGGILGLTPMIVAGGPMNLAYESGYKGAIDYDMDFASNEISYISFKHPVASQDASGAIVHGPYGYDSRIVFKESPNADKIKVGYQVGSTFKEPEVVLNKGTLEITGPQYIDQGGSFTLKNLYLVYAEVKESPYYARDITIEIPAGWKGTIAVPDHSRIYFENVDITGNVESAPSAKGSVKRLQIKNSTINGSVALSSENVLVSNSNITGSLDIKDLIDRYSVNISDSTITDLNLVGKGDMYVAGGTYTSTNITNTDGNVYGYLDDSLQNYNVTAKASLVADNMLVMQESNFPYSSRQQELQNLVDKYEANSIPVDDKVALVVPKKDAQTTHEGAPNQDSELPEGQQDPEDIYQFEGSSFNNRVIVPESQRYVYTNDNTVAPKKLTVNVYNGFFQLGFVGNDTVLGYSKLIPGAQLTKESMLSQSGQYVGFNEIQDFTPFNVYPAGEKLSK